MKRMIMMSVALTAAWSGWAQPKMIDREKVTVGVMYAPFCRTEYVNTNVWEQDIRKMSELGYKCLHGFSEWFRVERQPGVFDFSEVDLLVALCHKYGITPIINVCTSNGFGFYAPRWMQREYQGNGMVDSDGNGVPVKSQYVSPCLDDPWYLNYAERYLKALARHFAGDKRIGGWVIWGEPSLSKDGKPICYCEHTQRRFRNWLKAKYGTIEKLNRAWGFEGPSNWLSFDEVRPPLGPQAKAGSYESWTDFNNFMTSNFAKHIHRADTIMKENGATQPTINELFCWVMTGGLCNDHWALAKSSDIVGMSQYERCGTDVELSTTVADSIARSEGKSVFAVEAQGGPKFFGWGCQRTPGIDELRSIVVQSAGLGVKGVMYWCYRPRLTDFEGGTFGLCRTDGKPLPRAIETARLADDFAKLGHRLIDADRRPEVAILYQTGIHFGKNEKTADNRYNAIVGALRTMFDAHVTPRLVSETMIARGLPPEIKVLILPCAYVLEEPTAAGVKAFVAKGGTVIADYAVAFKRNNGYVYSELPGAGLREVFGVEKEEPLVLDDESLLPKDNHYAIRKCDYYPPSQLDLLTPTTAKVLERHDTLSVMRKDGSTWPLITVNDFGQGKAYYLVWEAFDNYARNEGNLVFRQKILSFLAEAGVKPFVSLGPTDQQAKPDLSTSVLYHPEGARIHTFVNPSYKSKQLVATIPGATKAEALYAGDVKFTTEKTAAGLVVRAPLAAWQSLMIEVR